MDLLDYGQTEEDEDLVLLKSPVSNQPKSWNQINYSETNHESDKFFAQSRVPHLSEFLANIIALLKQKVEWSTLVEICLPEKIPFKRPHGYKFEHLLYSFS